MLLLNINYIPDKKIETLGADAVISLTYTSSSLMQGAAEVTAYGTAVKIL